MKKQFLIILNLKDVKKRYKIDLIKTFKINFANINYFIESSNHLKNLPSVIAILLQLTESNVFSRIGCKSIHDKLNHIPFLTVHDSVLDEERFCDDVKSILENTIENHTNSVCYCSDLFFWCHFAEGEEASTFWFVNYNTI